MTNNVFHYTMPTSLISLLSSTTRCLLPWLAYCLPLHDAYFPDWLIVKNSLEWEYGQIDACEVSMYEQLSNTYHTQVQQLPSLHVVATVLLYVQRRHYRRTLLPYVLMGIVQYLFQRQENVASHVRRNRCKALDCRCQGDIRWWHSVTNMLKACLWWWSCKKKCRTNEKQQRLPSFTSSHHTPDQRYCIRRNQPMWTSASIPRML